jgi:hypothetical protein
MKKLPEPDFHDLEFSSGITFWTQGDAATRRVYLMPLSNPAEFLAFGVLVPPDTVLFVARGKVREHLGDFLANMERERARVELYAMPPLPRELIKRYTKDDPFEGAEEDPPRDPIKSGKIMAPTTAPEKQQGKGKPLDTTTQAKTGTE